MARTQASAAAFAAFLAFCAPPNAVAESVLETTLAGMAPNSWAKLNLNRYSSVWTPADQRASNRSPASNISAWSGAAWDSRRKRLMIWGGNIGYEEGNEFYIFDAVTGLWSRGALPSAVTVENGITTPVDGIFAAPTSGESWDNVVYLENADRVAVMGISRGGVNWLDPITLLATGPYFFDPDRADPDKVSGLTGSQVKPERYPDVIGGEMWQNRDSMPNSLRGGGKHGVTAYINGGDRDIVLFSTKWDHLYRYTVFDVDAPETDRWELIGSRPASGRDGYGAGDYDPSRRLFVKTLGHQFSYWVVPPTGKAGRAIAFTPANLSGVPVEQPIMFHGVAYDPVLDGFMLWSGGDTVWFLKPPAKLGPTGWTLERFVPSGVGPRISGLYTGVFGKWVYLKDEGAYIGVIDEVNGDVFVYKPDYGDSMPPPSNLLPEARFDFHCAGLQCRFTSTASDPDGAISAHLWRFGDGATSTLASPEHLYAQAGAYAVELTVTDDVGDTSTMSKSVEVVAAEADAPVLDFTTAAMVGYANQDRGGTVSIVDTGKHAVLSGNTWKRFLLDYNLTPDTVLEFEFLSRRAAEIHGIGLEQDNGLSPERIFQLYGSQSWGRQAFRNYTPSAWQQYRIPVGRFYVGRANALVLVNDDDGGRGAVGEFRNVRLYEGGDTPSASLQAPGDVRVEASAVLTHVDLGQPTVSADLRASHDAPAAGFPLGVTEVTWTADTADGVTLTAVQRVEVVDTTPPVIVAPPDVVLAQGVTIGNAQATDLFLTSVSNDAPSTFPVGETVVTWRAVDSSGNTATATQRVTQGGSDSAPDPEPGGIGFLDFANVTPKPFDNQDRKGGATVEEAGAVLKLSGNTWKRIDFPVVIEPGTVLEVEHEVTATGEIHAIGLETDNLATEHRFFQLDGSQRWGRQVSPEAADAQWQRYRIPVGKYYRGAVKYLVFVMDDDGQGRGSSRFRNVRVVTAP